jgi:hypothetical protein
MTDLSITWPAIGFRRSEFDGVPVGTEVIEYYPGADGFSLINERVLRNGAMVGMIVADSAGRGWRIEAIRNPTRVPRPWWRRFVTGNDVVYRVELDLAEIGPMPLDEVKARVCRCVDVFPNPYWDDEAMAGEAGPPISEEDWNAAIKARVMQAKDLLEVIKPLGPEEPS